MPPLPPPPAPFAPPLVVWDSPSADATGSMPLGNGDLALNAWVEPSGDLVFTVAKTDAWDEQARLLKLGRIRFSLTPARPAAGAFFRQSLLTSRGEFEVLLPAPSAAPGQPAAPAVLRLWVDARHPVVHLTLESPEPVAATARLELWRTAPETLPHVEISDVRFSHTLPGKQVAPTAVEPDSVLPARPGQLGWYHHNARSTGPRETMEHQDLAGLPGWTDPLLHRTFGALLRAADAAAPDDRTLVRPAATAHRFDVHVLTLHPSTPEQWRAAVEAQAARVEALDFAARHAAHAEWWRAFWDRSHLAISPTAASRDAAAPAELAQAWALQRYVTACAGRGACPIKFNGSLFTVEWPGKPGGPDYRRWGPGYWWQNTRLPYAGALAAGDADLLEPLFRMYAGPVRDASLLRAERHFGFKDALYLPECVYFWGAVFPESYGDTPAKDRADKLQDSRWHKREWSAALEFSHLLLEAYSYSGDKAFLRERALPFILPALRFFDLTYGDGPDGRMRLEPAQALETFWSAVNPAELVAGLRVVTARLLALPADLLPAPDRARVAALAARLPELPVEEKDGTRRLAPAAAYDVLKNSELPELYPVWPYRLVSFEKPTAPLGLAALDQRAFRGAVGWRQDELFMAVLGRAEEARAHLVARVRTRGADLLRGETYAMSFPGFWGPGFDWLPDQCHGGVLQAALQAMLLQSEGDQIFLLPAWPRDWDVSFKLHAPRGTVVEAEFRAGRLVRLEVDPPARRADLVIPPDLRPAAK